MKKTWIGIAALMMALAVFCAACGGSDAPAPSEAPAAEPEATELPSVTAPPQEGETGTNMVSANANDTSLATAHLDRDSWLASLSEDQRKVEEELIGATVEELYAAIGKPSGVSYSASCLVTDGEDGLLQYDGFMVSTTRFSSGQELVMGTSN